MAETRIERAATLHEGAAGVEATARRTATAMRLERDAILRELRAEDPQSWTYQQLAESVGCSAELIYQVVKGRTRRDHPTPTDVKE